MQAIQGSLHLSFNFSFPPKLYCCVGRYTLETNLVKKLFIKSLKSLIALDSFF